MDDCIHDQNLETAFRLMVGLFSGLAPYGTHSKSERFGNTSPRKFQFPASVHTERTNILMATKLYVGNLSFNMTENDLEDLFASVGPVQESIIMQDRMTMKSRGFGFVTMSETSDGQKAIDQFNGKQIDGRALTVNEAKPREERAGGGYGGGGQRSGGGSQRSYGDDRPRGGGGYQRR